MHAFTKTMKMYRIYLCIFFNFLQKHFLFCVTQDRFCIFNCMIILKNCNWLDNTVWLQILNKLFKKKKVTHVVVSVSFEITNPQGKIVLNIRVKCRYGCQNLITDIIYLKKNSICFIKPLSERRSLSWVDPRTNLPLSSFSRMKVLQLIR